MLLTPSIWDRDICQVSLGSWFQAMHYGQRKPSKGKEY